MHCVTHLTTPSCLRGISSFGENGNRQQLGLIANAKEKARGFLWKTVKLAKMTNVAKKALKLHQQNAKSVRYKMIA